MSTTAIAPTFAFDGKNADAQRVAAQQAADLVRDTSAETKAGLRAVIVRAIREGIPPYDAARVIVGMIGLTEKQALAVMNYREGLIDLGHPLDRVDALVERYAQRKLRERAETIAQTEIIGALNTGAEESWRQAQADGLLPRGTRKQWIVTPDDRLCPICRPMEGVTVPIGEEFSLPGPPAHPRCRCTVAVVTP